MLENSTSVDLLSPAAIFAPLYHPYHLKWSFQAQWVLLEWHFVPCFLEENSQGRTTGSGQKTEALWRSFGEGRKIALIGPAVTVALKAQAFSPWVYLIVPRSLSQTRIPPRQLRAFSRRARGRELSVLEPRFHLPAAPDIFGWSEETQ